MAKKKVRQAIPLEWNKFENDNIFSPKTLSTSMDSKQSMIALAWYLTAICIGGTERWLVRSL